MDEDDPDLRKGRESTGAGSEQYRTFRDYLAAKRAARVRYPYTIRGPLSSPASDGGDPSGVPKPKKDHGGVAGAKPLLEGVTEDPARGLKAGEGVPQKTNNFLMTCAPAEYKRGQNLFVKNN
jgi:hypothetical protein